MKRRLFLKSGMAAGMAGMAAPSMLSGITIHTPRPKVYSPLGTLIPDPPYRLQNNENPRGLSPKAKEAIIAAFPAASLYGGGGGARRGLQGMIAAKHGVEQSFVAMGNGSGDTLRQAPQAVGRDGMHVIAGNPSYATPGANQFQNVKVTRVPLTADFKLDIAAMRRAAADPAPFTFVYVCQPNNPTGTLAGTSELDKWIEEADEATTYFLVDEAYHHYVTDPNYKSSDRFVATKRNVIVARTFSKIYAMAGLRVGYGLAHPDTARKLQALFGGGINALSESAAVVSMEDEAWEPESVRLNNQARDITYAGLRELKIEFIPTQANFFMHKITTELQAHNTRMREQGLMVGRAFPPMTTWSRVSFGLPDQMAYFVETLKVLRANSFI
jgi:histidinol-phosphate aminotransferase